MDLDHNSPDADGYQVRSLYFDSYDDEALYEKQSGIFHRQKIRLRTYGSNFDANGASAGNNTVKFEIKRKAGQLVRKDSITIDQEDAEQICNGEYAVMLKYENPILDEIYARFTSKLYKPKVIVEYRRVALTLPVSNIRITFDLNLHSNINHLDLFSQFENSVPVILEGKQILEVKYDEYFPDYLKKILSTVSAERMAISKYTLARRFHKTQKWEDN